MDRNSRDVLWNARTQRNYPADIGRFGRLAHTPKNDFVDETGIDPRARQERIDRDTAKFVGPQP